MLFPPPIPRAVIVELFNNRVAYRTVQAWRQGKAPAPRWAREIINKRLDADIAYRAAHRLPIVD